MADARKTQEMEFELALTGVLEDIYDLRVRSARDPLNRRANGYAVLDFEYQYDGASPEVKVVVSIRGSEDASYAMHADFSTPESLVASAEQCEDLAMAAQGHLDGAGDPGLDALERRWDDY